MFLFRGIPDHQNVLFSHSQAENVTERILTETAIILFVYLEVMFASIDYIWIKQAVDLDRGHQRPVRN